MSRASRSWALALAAAAVFLWGVIGLFNRQFASGELYPEFSTMRTDGMGARLLFDSLGKLPGITVERSFLPFEFLPRDGATLVLLGMKPMQVDWNYALFLGPVERMAARGNRVVVAMWIDPDGSRPTQADLDHPEEPKAKDAKQKPKAATPQDPPIRTMWKVSLKIDSDAKNPHPLYFGQAEGWRVREQIGSKILAIERDFGKGSVVLMAESSDFTNQSAVALDRLRQVAEALGGYRRIVFDEEHLGIAESGSVVGLARQFRLMGLAIGLALSAVLFIWRSASSFPPPEPARAGERSIGRTSQAGLLTLLKRHIPPAQLAAVCWREWLSANGGEVSPERRKRAEDILAASAGRPVEATREIQALLHAKGEL
jgi:hypothetical protein